ncbi:DNA-(apurinic or apyrimidinic site) endonuclease 2 [Amia ocellicauda]|uniref:DNA-(apurinic or apyrimidinic site) endonuclease 2 n=1 Tax=Amia ocellicauda TaxID=2972642 RepID=UPI003463C02B
MKIVSWNINGIRTFKGGFKKALDSLDADIVCLQETKVTRDLLDERTAIVEGYSSYFSFSRGRSGYSGVATFCKDSATPFAAEEGLTGLLTNHGGAVGCYGEQTEFSNEELQALDSEGRAVVTQHRVTCADGGEKTLAVLNVYCPRADPEKPERKLFKLRFYALLQTRAEAVLGAGHHVIVLGDVNTSHRPIDHCDPDDIDNFEEHPGRKWLDNFLFGKNQEEEMEEEEEEEEAVKSRNSRSHSRGGRFVDTFRYFHPTRSHAFTCWSTLTGARQTNYGTRIDYIFADRSLAETEFVDSDIMPEVEGSDHCPVRGHLRCASLPNPRCPPLCTRHMPEFAGRQQKLSRFLVKVDPARAQAQADSQLPGSQESGEMRENLRPANGTGSGRAEKRGPLAEPLSSKNKKAKTSGSKAKPQGSLLSFFKPKPSEANHTVPSQSDAALRLDKEDPSKHLKNHCLAPVGRDPADGLERSSRMPPEEPEDGLDFGLVDPEGKRETSREEPSSDKGVSRGVIPAPEGDGGASGTPAPREAGGFWKSVLRGPPPPPSCKVHGEPCVLRTVKKAGPNLGRQFFVCARPQGHTSNPEARCNFFTWVGKGK